MAHDNQQLAGFCQLLGHISIPASTTYTDTTLQYCILQEFFALHLNKRAFALRTSKVLTLCVAYPCVWSIRTSRNVGRKEWVFLLVRCGLCA